MRPIGLTAARFREIEGKVMTWCRERVSPPLVPVVDELPSDDPASRVLVFTVLATGAAHALRDDERSRHWVRISRETREARNGLLLRLLSMKGQMEPWDQRINPEATVDDLDLLALRDALVQMERWNPTQGIERWLDPDVELSAFVPPLCGRMPGSGQVRPRNFALLLFGRKPQRFVPGAVSTFSTHPGMDRGEPYSEATSFGGTLVSQASRLIERLENVATRVTDKSSGGVENVARFPVRALTEAVVNAIVHRDYTSAQPTRIVAFSDRIEIWSPGGLDPKVKAEDFLQGRAQPVWRNRSLAWFFVHLDLAQAEGQGVTLIIQSMEKAGCPPPRFELSEDTMLCVLPAHPRHGRVRELQRIEEDFRPGRMSEAIVGAESLLRDDPYNFRTIALLTELARATQDASAVARFVGQHRDQLHSFPAAAQLVLAEALALPNGEPALVPELLRLASRGHLELGFAVRLLIALLLIGETESASTLLKHLLAEHPDWRDQSALANFRALLGDGPPLPSKQSQ